MAGYCDQSDLERRLTLPLLVELTDDTVPPTAVDAAVLGDEIAAAGEVVDGYLRDRYLLPLDPVPGLIRTIAADIVALKLWGRRPDTKGEAPKNLQKGFDVAMRMLREIQEGKLTLGVVAGQPEVPAHTVGIRVNKRRREFDADTLERF